MTALIVAAVVFCLLTATYFIYCEYRVTPLHRLFAKTVASFGFVALGILCALQSSATTVAALLLGGLALGMLGDIFLAMRKVAPAQKDDFFLAGLIAFFLGHLCYIFMLLQTGAFSLWLLLPAAALMVAMLLLKQRRELDFGRQALPAHLYAALVSLLAGTAIYGVCGNFGAYSLVTVVAVLLFAFSDSVLAELYFGKAPDRKLKFINLSTYYTAQILLALSLLLY